MNEKLNYENTSAQAEMKPKNYYLNPDGSIKRFVFWEDIMRASGSKGVPVATSLREFFDKSVLSKKEMADFALYTTHNAELIQSAVTLIHSLKITEQEAPSANIIVEYFGNSGIDPAIRGLSWDIDALMNWPLGTVMPDTRKDLSRFQRKS